MLWRFLVDWGPFCRRKAGQEGAYPTPAQAPVSLSSHVRVRPDSPLAVLPPTTALTDAERVKQAPGVWEDVASEDMPS